MPRRTSPQDIAVRDLIEQEHWRYRANPDAQRRPGEVELPAGDPVLQTEETPLLRTMRDDFRRFCDSWIGHQLGLHWQLDDVADPPSKLVDPALEAFRLEVAAGQVTLHAAHERGLLQGTHYLERCLADRGGPFLQPGTCVRTPRFMPRISNGVFIDSGQDIGDDEAFSDEYLSLMSHFGVNGIHLAAHLSEIWQSDTLPELNNPEAAKTLAGLASFVKRAKRYGIDLYLYLALAPIAADHPVFAANERRRGAHTVMSDIHRMRKYHCLCIGSEDVLKAYEEVITWIYTQVPDLGGALVITGGEGLIHCYTRPAKPHDGYTSCPHCQDMPPSGVLSAYVNRLGGALKRVDPSKTLFVWPYSAFTWSGDDRAQVEWINGLSDDVELLSNFATGSTDETTDGGVFLYDYNIKRVGPSAPFQCQAQAARESQRRIFAKIETNTNPDVFFLPYIPVHHRWCARYAAMAETGVHGFVGQWRFYGMNGSPPEELQYQATWNPERSADDLLSTIARRDFGLDDAGAEAAVDAWRHLSEAWDHYPYSSMTAGERAHYMRGPLYLGPSHPLIFNVQSRYDLGYEFFILRGDAAELLSDEEYEMLQRKAPPRYVSDLTLVMPFGVTRYRELLRACRDAWGRGLRGLRQALGEQPNDRARMELDVVETMDIHFTTLAHVVDFYDLREQLARQSLDLASFEQQLERLHALVRREIANARRILPILDRDPRIGYGHCYNIVYTRSMVEQKIAQCNYLLEQELPTFDYGVRFHLWNDF